MADDKQNSAAGSEILKRAKPHAFSLAFYSDDQKFEGGAGQYAGSVSNLSDASQHFRWMIICLDEETPHCIAGTNVSELNVKDDLDEGAGARFEKGIWLIAPETDLLCTICYELIEIHADKTPMQPVQQKQPSRPTGRPRKRKGP